MTDYLRSGRRTDSGRLPAADSVASSVPIIATDRIGFVWIAALFPGDGKDSVPVIYMFGPIFTSRALNLSDFFVQRIEAAETVSEVHGIGARMHQVYINRVRHSKQTAKHSSLVRNCIDYVETHIFDRITLRTAANALGYSETYISRKFKEETGESLVDYVNRQKMNTAKSILAESDISIAELSERLSISSPSYFSTLFRRQFGMNRWIFKRKEKKSDAFGKDTETA